LPRPNWSRALPRSLVIPKVMTLRTLGDVRVLIERHLPQHYRAKATWRYVGGGWRRRHAAATPSTSPVPLVCMGQINALAGERNAAMHTSWAVAVSGDQFVPVPQIPTHRALKPDFAAQFQSLRERLNDQYLALNEVRKAFDAKTVRQSN